MVRLAIALFIICSSLCAFGADDSAKKDFTGDQIDQLMKKQTEGTVESQKTVAPATATDSSGASDATAAEKTASESQPVFKSDRITAKENSAKDMKPLTRMLLGLAIVFAMMGGSFFAFKKWPAGKKFAQKSRMIEVVAQNHIGPRKSIAVVKVAGEAVLIGITDNSINFLKNLTLIDDEPTPQKFSEALIKKVANKRESGDPDEFTMQSLKTLIGERLKSMKEI